GAYRDNEVDPAHPLMRRMAAIRKTGAAVQEIILAPLGGDDLQRLVGDALRCEPERAAPLAGLLLSKTQGNPFFAIQFLRSLAEEELLKFDHRGGAWSWDFKRIHAKNYTDNVVDLMVAKMHRLPLETQRALQQMACMGNSADFALLAAVYQGSEPEMHRELLE